jgi:hypothetical protein
VSAVVLPPQAASAARAADARTDFNANAYRERWLRRIELMRVSQDSKLQKNYFAAPTRFDRKL